MRSSSTFYSPEEIAKIGEDRIAKEQKGIIRADDNIIVSYVMDDKHLHTNFNATQTETGKTDFCWYSSVPQIVAVNSTEDKQKCNIKFCSADVKCKVRNTLVDYKAVCNAIGANYDKCPKAVDCINKKSISVNNPSNWMPYVERQKRIDAGEPISVGTGELDPKEEPITEEEKVAWEYRRRKKAQLDRLDKENTREPFMRYLKAESEYKKGIIDYEALN